MNKSRLKTIAVLGPSANDTAGYERCFDLDFGLPAGGGCLYSHIYRGYSSFISTPLMGISSALDGTGIKVLYASGSAPGQPEGALRNSKDASGVGAAAALAAKADVAIVVVGLVRVSLCLPACLPACLLACLHVCLHVCLPAVSPYA